MTKFLNLNTNSTAWAAVWCLLISISVGCDEGSPQVKADEQAAAPAMDEAAIADRVAGWANQIHTDFQTFDSPSNRDITTYCNVMVLAGHTDRMQQAIKDALPTNKTISGAEPLAF